MGLECKHIVFNELISSGAPTVSGRRLTVFNIVSKLFYENSLESVLEDYEISLEIIEEAVNYCSHLNCKKDKRLIKFCSGCVLRTLQDGWEFDRSFFEEFNIGDTTHQITISKDKERIFLGTINELENAAFGKLGWLLAMSLKEKYNIKG